MNITYGLVEEKYFVGVDVRVSYGVAAFADADVDGSATIVLSIHDISSDREILSKLVSLCNRMKLSIHHFNDIIEYFLAD